MKVKKIAVNLVEDNKTKSKYDRNDWKDFFYGARVRRESNNYSYKEYEDEFKEYIRGQISTKENADTLKKSRLYYREAIDEDYFNKNYVSIEDKYVKRILSICKLLIITANPIERAVLHHKVIDNGSCVLIRSICNTTAFYVFKWGEYWVVHIHQGDTGAEKDLGTSIAINEALKYFTPNVIISLGVAFGIDYNIQHIGNVLVSKRLFPYSDNKRDEDKVKPARTQDKTIDDWLHVRLQNAIGFMDNVTYGDILSGGSVMSSCEEKDRLCASYTEEDFIIGGEMEGNAVFQCTKRMGIPGVVIKGICDFGIIKNGLSDGGPDEEEVIKESLQAFAMMQAVDKCKPLVNDIVLFSSPKQPDSKKLLSKYNACIILFIISQFITMFLGIVMPFIAHKAIWIANEIVLLIALIISHNWFAIQQYIGYGFVKKLIFKNKDKQK